MSRTVVLVVVLVASVVVVMPFVAGRNRSLPVVEEEDAGPETPKNLVVRQAEQDPIVEVVEEEPAEPDPLTTAHKAQPYQWFLRRFRRSLVSWNDPFDSLMDDGGYYGFDEQSRPYAKLGKRSMEMEVPHADIPNDILYLAPRWGKRAASPLRIGKRVTSNMRFRSPLPSDNFVFAPRFEEGLRRVDEPLEVPPAVIEDLDDVVDKRVVMHMLPARSRIPLMRLFYT
ncbi:hypothetical protein AAVH_14969 [Aphelenchoides avenae]|nr:hypothetical protein AAVH_14969 [Aphelenchus avenae]